MERMDNRAFRHLLCDSPHTALLEAIDGGQDLRILGPLLDDELRRSSSRLQRLKEYRNALTSPMYRLHPEIVSNIFYIYAKDNNELFNLRWTRLLFVCRRWHDIAMHTLSLWSFIDIGIAEESTYAVSHSKNECDARDIRRIELQRSRAALSPLTIRMSLYSMLSETKLAYASMYWNPGSLRSLTLNGEEFYVDEVVRVLAAHQHATLETLELHCFDHGNAPRPVRVETQRPLDVVLKGNVPQLSNLAITGISFDWTLVHGLRSLRIAYMTDASCTLQDVVCTLSRCPQLEQLAVRLPLTSHPDVSISSAVVLACIDTIIIQAASEVCTHLFEALSIPSSAKILTSTTGTVDGSPVSALVSFMGSHAARDSAPVIRSITMAFTLLPPMVDEDNENIIAPSTSRLGIVGQMTPKRLGRGAVSRWFYAWQSFSYLPYITLETTTPVADEVQLLKSTLQCWPLAGVTHLDMRMADFDPEHLGVMLAELPGATTVVLRPESITAQRLLKILDIQLHENGQRVFANIIFDAAEVTYHPRHAAWNDIPPPSTAVLARRTMMRTLLYCERAARTGVPLDVIGIVSEPGEMRHRLIGRTEDVVWSELYGSLQDGFVYERVLHSGNPDLDSTEWDLYTV